MSIDLFNIEFFKNISLILKPKNLIPKLEIKTLNELGNIIDKKYRGVIFDVDQTLVLYGSMEIDKTVIENIEKIKQNFSCCLLSNFPSKKEKLDRLKFISTKLGIPIALSPKKKPAPEAFLTALEILKMDSNNVVMVGDRIFTDIIGANQLGIFTIYIKPINMWKDPFFFVTVPRIIENIFYKLIKLFLGANK